MAALWARAHEMCGHLHIAKGTPLPARRGPKLITSVATVHHKLQEFTIGDLELGGFESRNSVCALSVLVIPPERRKFAALAEGYIGLRHRNHTVYGVMNACHRCLDGVNRGSVFRGHLGRWMIRGKALGKGHELQRKLRNEERRCLEVDSLVFKCHHQRPQRTFLVDAQQLLLTQVGNECGDGLVDLGAVLVHFGDTRPGHFVL
mmetsp:Transcript_20076/g.34831  ORF Transcript_20076/g.34831 Transcript_20076/m.34831 type:complete len:204 (-) Transcript_20076:824-1435(-)